MADSVVESIADEIVTLIKVAHTSYDLSGADAVKRGRFSQPWNTPCACVAFLSMESSRSGDASGSVPMGKYARAATFEITGWATVRSTTTKTELAMENAALALADDLMRALETTTARKLGGFAHDSEVQAGGVDGNSATAGAGDMAICRLTLTAWFHVTAGL